jgi:hypothetical protein
MVQQDRGVDRRTASVIAGGGLLVVLLGVLVGSVIWVSNTSNRPLVQPNPTTTSAPTVAAGSLPLPTTTIAEPPPPTPGATFAMPPPELTAEMITPPPQFPRRLLLHQLFPQLFPDG